MSDANDDFDADLFEIGEMIVVTLKDGRHYLGSFTGFYDTGVAIKIEAKTAYKVEKFTDSKFIQAVQARATEELSTLKSEADWYQKALQLNPMENSINFFKLSPKDIKDLVTEQVYNNHRKWVSQLWQEPIVEQDVTKPYLRELKRSIRTLVHWDKIDEVCSAVEMAEEAEIADLSNLIDNGEFLDLINNMNEGEIND